MRQEFQPGVGVGGFAEAEAKGWCWMRESAWPCGTQLGALSFVV